MYISIHQLNKQMGVDMDIARFFVDRKVPQDNLFWHKRLLYIGRGSGFICIPVFYDLLHRLGVPKEELMSEYRIQFMERGMHFATMLELNQLDYGAYVAAISALLSEEERQHPFFAEFSIYIQRPTLSPIGRLGTPVKALNRGDAFLFILCQLSLNEQQLNDAIKYFYALVPTYLAIDDIEDYTDDKEGGQENAIIELGDGIDGFQKLDLLMRENIRVMREINPVVSDHIEQSLEPLKKIFEHYYSIYAAR